MEHSTFDFWHQGINVNLCDWCYHTLVFLRDEAIDTNKFTLCQGITIEKPVTMSSGIDLGFTWRCEYYDDEKLRERLRNIPFNLEVRNREENKWIEVKNAAIESFHTYSIPEELVNHIMSYLYTATLYQPPPDKPGKIEFLGPIFIKYPQ